MPQTKVNIKEQKASIVLVVTAVMLFIVVVLALAYTNIINKTSAQNKDIQQIKKEYDQNIDNTYKQVIENI